MAVYNTANLQQGEIDLNMIEKSDRLYHTDAIMHVSSQRVSKYYP